MNMNEMNKSPWMNDLCVYIAVALIFIALNRILQHKLKEMRRVFFDFILLNDMQMRLNSWNNTCDVHLDVKRRDQLLNEYYVFKKL